MKQEELFRDLEDEGKWERVCHFGDLEEGRGRLVEVGGRALAVFLVSGQVEVIDSRCTHANAPLWRGWVENGVVICPLHRWKFELGTGRCLTEPGKPVGHYRSRVDGDGEVWVENSGVGGL